MELIIILTLTCALALARTMALAGGDVVPTTLTGFLFKTLLILMTAVL